MTDSWRSEWLDGNSLGGTVKVVEPGARGARAAREARGDTNLKYPDTLGDQRHCNKQQCLL